MDFDKLNDQDIAGLAEIGVTLPINAVVLRDYLPHRYPFMLLDRVTAVKPNEWITGLKNITINEPFFNGHFPEEPIMPGAKGVIGVKYATDRVGPFTKTVTITSNAAGQPTKTLTIKGNVLPDEVKS